MPAGSSQPRRRYQATHCLFLPSEHAGRPEEVPADAVGGEVTGVSGLMEPVCAFYIKSKSSELKTYQSSFQGPGRVVPRNMDYRLGGGDRGNPQGTLGETVWREMREHVQGRERGKQRFELYIWKAGAQLRRDSLEEREHQRRGGGAWHGSKAFPATRWQRSGGGGIYG